jgi:hypothetical protein
MRDPVRSLLPVLATLLLGANLSAAAPREDAGERRPDAGHRRSKHDRPEHRRQRLEDLPVGTSGVARGDFNGDGFGDLAVGAPLEDLSGGSDSGAVNVVYGTANGLSATRNQFWHQSVTGVPGDPRPDDHFGWSLASGNFNGDAYSDLAIGVPNEGLPMRTGATAVGAGVVHILYGSANGLTTTGNQLLSMSSWTGGPSGDEHFGWSLAWGDFNNDGLGDLAVGITGISFRAGVNDAGMVTVFYGSVDEGLREGSADVQALHPPDGFAGIGSDSENFDLYGATLAVGDFNGDDHDDLAVGVPYEDLGLFNDVTNTGKVMIYPGVRGGLDTSAPVELVQDIGDRMKDEPFDHFGAALTTGDFDGDGRSDLAVGIPGENLGGGSDSGGLIEGTSRGDTGAVMVYPGQPGLNTSLNRSIRTVWAQDSPGLAGGEEDGDAFGFSLAAGDFNGDGTKDLAVGIPFEDLTVNNVVVADAGMVQILYGSSEVGLQVANDQFWDQAQGWGTGSSERGDRFGYSLTAWDFGKNTGGAKADLAIGVPGEELFTIPEVGMVQVLYGTGTGLSTTGNQFWHQANLQGTVEAGDQFGLAMY